ncbi:hypothetical protein GTO27_04150, partial [Candidatus Bathyarchaeota archaeon]|nr:hypothetical protein [Candidatus Bathyarchaeota archaeon]
TEAKDSVRVGGRIETVKGVKAARVEIGRRGRIRGPVVANEVLLRERAEADDIYADSLTMEERSRARNVYAKRVFLERGCRITGELQYTEEMKKEEGIQFAEEPRKTDKLPSPPI